MIRVTPTIFINEDDIKERFIRASGPGGQNVNKVSSAVQLRFNVNAATTVPQDVKVRLKRIAGRQMTEDGVLIIEARRHRTQGRNRQDAFERLTELLRRASLRPKPRKPTRPTLASRRRRLDGKRRRSEIKRARGRITDSD